MNEETPPRAAHAARVPLRSQVRMASWRTTARHRTRWGTTNYAVRDFRDRSGPFVARARSHLTTAAGTDHLRRGKQATILAPAQSKKSFYINSLRGGGGRRIRTLSTPKASPA
jgi:hypothetical protein